ncbi:glutathione S-transferase family protein [Novosphingobium beihaiensis]|uniref:Glutathione S-transferase N-terminal domain-containing protein n=1 Tax=Novosphingobium beihaiensis TaxID=2930389 RepID=A0ABT0BTP2_9SPHN|nr:glutathione S-transferase N-terminal domain-containing protein [Novosphingobium beihaiensis]MCJ2188434.1 glutathione S-transferase N-terminal domain-containing protein [Novosphingobium beihaiensis]
MIDLHFTPSPNSLKIKIALEELGLPYKVIRYDLYKGDHLAPAYRAVNPNVKLPGIVDHDPQDGGEPFSVFESGAILQYLAEKTGKLLPENWRERSQAIQWLTWQVAGVGPMMGQAGHFLRYAPPGDHAYSTQRYVNESKRLVQVLDNRLKRNAYLAGSTYSIADIAAWPVVQIFSPYVGIDLEPFPNARRWLGTIAQRPAVQASLNSPDMGPGRHYDAQPKLNEEEWSNTFGERMFNAVRED